jgi:hypothetical protein
MTGAAEEAVSTQVRLRVIGKPRACPVCDGKLHGLGAMRWGCEKGHTVTYHPEPAEAAHAVSMGWAEGASEGPGSSSAVQTRGQQTPDSQPTQVGIPLLTREELADSRAAWERKLKRGRQRRWRARKRAGLV